MSAYSLTAVAIGMLCASCPGACLTDVDILDGTVPQIGDVVTLSDFARCEPSGAIGSDSVKGNWWLRPYKTPTSSGRILCVEQRDREQPETCIAPTLTYPAKLPGVYDIWLATYRPGFGGGIDIRLSGDKAFSHVDPWEEPLNAWNPPAQEGHLVECFYKTADLTDQDILLRQPKGTYQSFWWGLCNAHVAYIKLIRRDPAELRMEANERAGLQRKGVIVDRDGFSYVWNWGVDDVSCILEQVQQFGYGNVEALNWCIGGSLTTNFPHPMAGRIATRDRLGDRRATAIYQGFIDRGIDILKVLCDRSHELGIKIYASHRANVHYYPSKVWDEHPHWRLKSGGGLDYAHPDARGYYRDLLLYIARNYDVDGLTVDFTRHRRHFNPGQPDQFQHMNTYMRELRAGLDRIGREKGHKLALNASFNCGTWYDGWTPEQQGLDVATWVAEGIVDCIMPEGKEHMKYLQMTRGTAVKCYPRVTYQCTFDGDAAGPNIHDPTPGEDNQDRSDNWHLGPMDYVKGVLSWYDAGAGGVMLFNLPDAWTTLRELPYPELLRKRVETGTPYGRVEGEAVAWEG